MAPDPQSTCTCPPGWPMPLHIRCPVGHESDVERHYSRCALYDRRLHAAAAWCPVPDCFGNAQARPRGGPLREETIMAEDNGIQQLTALVTRLERLFDQQHPTNQDVNSRFERMAARWDGYIVELRQFNQRLQIILERLLPRGGANGGETAP